MRLPSERTLPNKQAVLDRVLADEDPRVRPAWMIPLAAAASVAVIAGGLAIGPRLAGGTSPTPAPPPAASPTPAPTNQAPAPGERSIQLDLGPIAGSEARELATACVRDGKGGVIVHAVRVRSWGRKATELSVVVRNSGDGLVLGCVGYPTTKSRSGDIVEGFDSGVVGGNPAAARESKIVINSSDATHPAVPTEVNSARAFIEFDAGLDKLVREAWYRVDDRVDRMRQRFVVKGKPGPWYVAKASDGYVFLRSWDESTALRQGDAVRIETQVIGRQGNLLDAPADQLGGGGLTQSPGTTRVETGTVKPMAGQPGQGTIDFTQ